MPESRQPTPAMQLRAVVSSLEGNFLNWKEGACSAGKLEEEIERHLSAIKALYPHLDVGCWINCDTGGVSCG